MIDTRRDTSHYPTARWPAGVAITIDPIASEAIIESNELVVWAISVAYEEREPVIDPTRPAAVKWTRGRQLRARKDRPDPYQFIPPGAVVRIASTKILGVA